MCLCSQLPRPDSSGHGLKQKKLWVSISGSSPSLLGQAFAALCQALWIPPSCSGTGSTRQKCSRLTMEVTIWGNWCISLPAQPSLQTLCDTPHRGLPPRAGWESHRELGALVPVLHLVGLRWAPRKGLAAAWMDPGNIRRCPQVT